MKILNVAKAALYAIFLNYYCYYTLRGSFIPGGTVIFLCVGMLCVGVDVLQQRRVHVGTEVRCWVIYALLAFITTGLVTMDSGSTAFISDIVKFVQRLLIIMMVAYVCEREGSIRFGLRLMAVTAVSASIAIMLVVDNIQLKLDISSGASLSANDIGALMAFGCFAVVFAWGNRRNASMMLSLLKTIGFICCLTVIFLAGSRKSIAAVAIMLAALVLLCLGDYSRKLNLKKMLALIVVGAAVYLLVIENLLPYAEQTNLYTRLFGRGTQAANESDSLRVDLYRWAWEDFLNHPAFGLGFNQYVNYHGNYTHSTYAEPLACSGLIGLLYLYPYFSMVRKQLFLIAVNRRGSYARLKQKEILAYLGMFLFVGIGIPYMYKDIPCILLGTFIASQAISFRELKTLGYTSGEY